MSRVIDDRIVEMKFDNKDFEKNVQTSMDTLDNLKKELKMEDAADGLTGIGQAARDIDLSSLSDSIQSISDRFSTMGIIGMTVVSELTKAVMHTIGNIASQVGEMIKTGGLTRALNIEKAKFQLEGLGVAWADIYNNIDAAVTGTAYSLDSAALVASQLVASGVEYGDELSGMAISLRAISGVAAMTSSTYDEIGEIFTTVAGQGKLMTMQLRQLEGRGLNAAATLGKVLGKSEAEVREMVTKGQIDFMTFSSAMNEAFGDHAMEANKTLTGVLANTKSALGRIGAEFLTPLIQNEGPLVNMIEQLRLKINEFKSTIGPVANIVTTFLAKTMESVGKIISSLDVKGAMSNFYTYFFKVWKIVYVVRDLLKAFSPVLATIKDAFNEMLPYSLGKGLGNLIEQLHKLTSNFKFSEKEIDKINRAFKGFFAIIDIGIQALKGLVSPLLTAMGFGEIMADGFLSASASIGDFLVKLDSMVKKSGIFNTIGNYISTGMMYIAGAMAEIGNYIASLPFDKYYAKIKKVFDSIYNYVMSIPFEDIYKKLKKAFSSIDEFVLTIKDSFEGLENIDLSGFNKFVEEFVEKADPLAKVSAVISFAFETIKSAVMKIASYVGPALSVVKDALGEFARVVIDTFSSGGDLTEALKNTTLAVAFYQLKNVFIQLKNLPKALVPVKGELNQTLIQLKDTLLQFEKSLNADYFIKIAGSILILAFALKMLSSLDEDALGVGLAGVTALMTELYLVMANMQKLKPEGIINSSATALITMSIAVLLLAKAVTALGQADPKTLEKGLTAVTVLLIELTTVANALGAAEGEMMKGITGIIAIAIALRILVKAVEQLGSMDMSVLENGLVAVSALLIALSLAAEKMNDKKLISAGVGMIALGVAIRILTGAIEKLGSMDLMTLGVGLIALFVVLMELSEAANRMDGKKLISAGIGILMLSAGILILTQAIKSMGEMKPDQLIQGIIALGAVLLELCIVAQIANENVAGFLTAGASLLVMSVAITILAGALAILSTFSPEQMITSIVMLGGSLFILAAGVSVMSECLAGAAAMLVVAGAVAILAPALLLLSAISLNGMIMAFTALAGTIVIFAVAATALEGAIGPMAALGAALIVLGAGIFLVGTGLAALSAGILAFIGMLAAIGGLSEQVCDSIVKTMTMVIDIAIQLVPQFVSLITTMLASILENVTTLLPIIGDLILEFINTVCNIFLEAVPTIVETMAELWLALMDMAIEYAPEMIDSIGTLITTILSGLADWIPQIADAAVELMTAFINAVADSQLALIDAAFQAMIGFINGLADSIRQNMPLVIDAVDNLFDALIEAAIMVLTNSFSQFKEKGASIITYFKTGITSKISLAKSGMETIINGVKNAANKLGEFKEVGKNIVQGLINGLNEMLQSAINTASNLGTQILNAAKASLGIQSPSREFKKVGRYVDEGLIIGLQKYSGKVVDAAIDVAEETYNVMSDTLSGMSDIMDDIEGEPVIAPVLDLSNVRRGAGEINGLLSSNQANAIAANMTVSNNADMMAQQTSSLADMIKAANQDYANSIIEAISNANGDVTVNVQLSGDASSIFKVVRTENQKFSKATGRSAFA